MAVLYPDVDAAAQSEHAAIDPAGVGRGESGSGTITRARFALSSSCRADDWSRSENCRLLSAVFSPACCSARSSWDASRRNRSSVSARSTTSREVTWPSRSTSRRTSIRPSSGGSRRISNRLRPACMRAAISMASAGDRHQRRRGAGMPCGTPRSAAARCSACVLATDARRFGRPGCIAPEAGCVSASPVGGGAGSGAAVACAAPCGLASCLPGGPPPAAAGPLCSGAFGVGGSCCSGSPESALRPAWLRIRGVERGRAVRAAVAAVCSAPLRAAAPNIRLPEAAAGLARGRSAAAAACRPESTGSLVDACRAAAPAASSRPVRPRRWRRRRRAA